MFSYFVTKITIFDSLMPSLMLFKHKKRLEKPLFMLFPAFMVPNGLN